MKSFSLGNSWNSTSAQGKVAACGESAARMVSTDDIGAITHDLVSWPCGIPGIAEIDRARGDPVGSRGDQ